MLTAHLFVVSSASLRFTPSMTSEVGLEEENEPLVNRRDNKVQDFLEELQDGVVGTDRVGRSCRRGIRWSDC